jgi:hypothetical protein
VAEKIESRSDPAAQGKITRTFVEDNALRIWRGFSYNRKVFRNRMFSRWKVPGVAPEHKMNARNLSEEKPE